MRATKKEEGLILNIYRRIYSEVGVDFDSVDKTSKNWFLDFFLPQEKQNEIIEEMLKTQKMTRLKRQMLRNTLYLGCLPRGNNEKYL